MYEDCSPPEKKPLLSGITTKRSQFSTSFTRAFLLILRKIVACCPYFKQKKSLNLFRDTKKQSSYRIQKEKAPS